MPINLNGKIPTTLEEAVDRVYLQMTENEKDYVLYNGTAGLHHGFGTDLRNKWGLWHDSVLATHIKEQYGLGHADDMSGLIFAGIEQRVKGEELDVSGDVEFYKAFWDQQGIDPLTQERK